MKTTLTLLLLLALTGCATVRYSDEGGKAQCDIENTCWKLFLCIPVGSGEPDEPNGVDFRLFRNSATVENHMKILDFACKAKNARATRNVVSRTTDESYSFLLKRTALHTSAELVR